MASRRIGKSFLIAIESFFYAAENPGSDCLLVAHNQDASNNLMRYVKNVARWMCRAPDAPIGLGDIDQAGAIGFDNGSIIKALPGGNPDHILGHGGSVWLDEFAFHRDQERNYNNAYPVLTQHAGVMRITSTPFSDGDLFWRICSNHEGEFPDWSRHNTTMVDAIANGLKTRKGTEIDIEKLRRGMPNPDEFDAAYMCRPLSDSASCFTWEWINRCRGRKPITEGSKYGGFDVARVTHGDAAVLGEVVRDGDSYGLQKTVWVERGTDFDSMQSMAIRDFTERGWLRMGVDGNGIGMETAERLQKQLGISRVDICKMTPGDKSDMVTTAQHLGNEGRLWIDDDRDLLLDMHAIKRIITDSANIRYDAERNKRGHADRAWAGFLAIRAAGHEVVKGSLSTAHGEERMNWGGGLGSRQDW